MQIQTSFGFSYGEDVSEGLDSFLQRNLVAQAAFLVKLSYGVGQHVNASVLSIGKNQTPAGIFHEMFYFVIIHRHRTHSTCILVEQPDLVRI